MHGGYTREFPVSLYGNGQLDDLLVLPADSNLKPRRIFQTDGSSAHGRVLA